jgi:hypothetical protein
MSHLNYRQINRSAGRSSKTWRLKKALLTLIAIGGLSFVTIGGVYAVFNSEEDNNHSSVETGTLTFTNQVNTGTVCQSYGSGSAVNVNSACSALATTSTLNYPGVLLAGNVAIANNGSLPAATLTVFMPSCTTELSPSAPTNPNWGSITLSSALSTSSAITSIGVASLTKAVTSGDSIVLTSGANTQTFVASANALIGATTISVTSQTPNFAYPTNSTVYDVGAGLCKVSGAEFYVQQVNGITLRSALSTGSAITSLPTTALSQAVSSGDSIVLTSGAHTQTFVASANALVGATTISVTSQTPNFAYPTTSTVIDTGTTIHLSSALSTGAAITSLPITSLSEAVTSGDSIVLTSGTSTQTYVASANALVGATTISVTSQTPNFAYPTSSVVNDVSPDTKCWYPNTGSTTCSVSGSTLYAFAANYNSSSSALNLGSGPVAAATRYFVIGMELPTNASNTLQGESATFPLTWHMTT